MGGSLVALKSDAATLALLTNPEVLDVDQHSTKSHAVSTTSTGALWTSERLSGGGFNVAFFNLQDRPQTVHLALPHLTWNFPPLRTKSAISGSAKIYRLPPRWTSRFLHTLPLSTGSPNLNVHQKAGRHKNLLRTPIPCNDSSISLTL